MNGRAARMLSIGLGLLAPLALPADARAELSDGKVRIGVIDDMSGGFADQTGAGSVLAARLAIEDFGGGVLGRPVELVFGDHQNKADIAANLARQWYDADQVDMIVGLSNSSVAIAVQTVARDKGKVSIVTGAGSVALTGRECSPTGFHWVYDTYAVARNTGSQMVREGGGSWFFITADYAFGQSLEADMTRAVLASGGTVVGSVKVPINTADYASFLLQAQSSGAKVVALATGGNDLINALKQAAEFGLTAGGQRLASPLTFITDVHALGLPTAGGLTSVSAFYWDLNDATRAWSERFFKQHKAMPTMAQAGVYSAVLHYLKAVQAAGGDAGPAVAERMRALPIDDFMTKNGRAREDGRVLRDLYLIQVKRPEESKKPWDYYRILATIPGEASFRPLAEGDCARVKGKS